MNQAWQTYPSCGEKTSCLHHPVNDDILWERRGSKPSWWSRFHDPYPAAHSRRRSGVNTLSAATSARTSFVVGILYMFELSQSTSSARQYVHARHQEDTLMMMKRNAKAKLCRVRDVGLTQVELRSSPDQQQALLRRPYYVNAWTCSKPWVSTPRMTCRQWDCLSTRGSSKKELLRRRKPISCLPSAFIQAWLKLPIWKRPPGWMKQSLQEWKITPTEQPEKKVTSKDTVKV